MKTSELSVGASVRLVGFGESEPLYRRRLLSLGLTCGATAVVVRVAPLGCPIQLDVAGTSIALRKAEACALVWELV